MRLFRRSRLTCFLIFTVPLLLVVRTVVNVYMYNPRLRLPAASDHHANLKRKQTATATHGTAIRSSPGAKFGEIDSQFVEKAEIDLRSPVEPLPIFITVKTGRAYHDTRIPVLLQTWFNYAPNETYFVTDTADGNDSRLTGLGEHLVASGCGEGHDRSSLCCKMGHELETFYLFGKEKDWFCHVDDDNYVNVPQLVHLLSQYGPNEDIYIGKSSLGRPLNMDWQIRMVPSELGNITKEPFWFGTGGAGICVSRHLAKRMEPYVRDGKFVKLCAITRLPDDCTMGFLSESVLRVKMTQSQLLHSHLEIPRVPREQLKKQVTFSYGRLGKWDSLIPLDGSFTRAEDPTRFKSYHCLLNPQVNWCPQHHQGTP